MRFSRKAAWWWRTHPEIVRTAIALGLLALFWGALARTFWPEVLTSILALIQSARGVGAAAVESAYLDVGNRSSAEAALVRQVVDQLDADCAAIEAFLGREAERRVPVLIVEGHGPALTDGVRLTVFHHDGAVDLSSAPYWLVLLSEGDLSLPGSNLFLEGGYAIYVVEEIGRAQELLGQPADAWVTGLGQSGVRPSLSHAQTVGVPRREGQMADALRALLVAGSFVRWVAGEYGIDAVHDLRDGLPVEEVLGRSLAEVEQAWLASVEAKGLTPQPCLEAVPSRSPVYALCDRIDPGGQ